MADLATLQDQEKCLSDAWPLKMRRLRIGSKWVLQLKGKPAWWITGAGQELGMSAQKRETTRPENQAVVVTNFLRQNCRQASASLKNSADALREASPLARREVPEYLSQKEFRLTTLFLDRAAPSRLSLRLT